MATEYKLNYTAAEINERLSQVGNPVSWNDLENKPFYEEDVKEILIPEQAIVFDNNGYANPIGIIDFNINTTVTIIFDGVAYESKIENGYFLGDDYIVSRFTINDNVPVVIVWDGIFVSASLVGEHTIFAYSGEYTIKQLDEKFIPDTIARKSDIGSANDILIPTEEETIKMLAESGIIEIVTDENGDIFTDKFGNVIAF